jgi:putative glycerol-1-phosphate prenyltransferase
MIYEKIKDTGKDSPLFALLIDPEKHHTQSLRHLVGQAERAAVDLILVGGSLLSQRLDQSIRVIKEHTSTPVVLFPGNLMQVSPYADGILFLSLISGRNPDLLIGNHVLSARMIKNSGLEVIPTGYILINGGSTSSVEYISNTKPIPTGKTDIITATALAGELLGHRLIYLESGSGANQPAYSELIGEVKKQVSLPLVVGGGLKTPDDLKNLCQTGADMVVVGNALEQNPDMLTDMTAALRSGAG